MMNETRRTVSVRGLIRRRKKAFLLCFLPIFTAAAVAGLALPSVYQSTATILIEGQQIPRNYVAATVTRYAEERIQAISQRVLGSRSLQNLIDSLGLYPEMVGRYTEADIRTKMRKSIKVATINPDDEERNRRIRRSTEGAVAFTISYEGKDPETVRQVASLLADYYLEENLRTRSQEAAGTTAFFEQQQQELQEQIEELEKSISRFKNEHLGTLPENTPFNIQVAQRLNRDLDSYLSRIQTFQDRKILLQGRLATVDPYLPLVPVESTEKKLADQLMEQRLQLATLQAKFSDAHPDVVRTRKVIAELETQVAERTKVESKIEHLAQLRATLAGLQGRYGPRHPDVLRLSREVNTLTAEIAAAAPALDEAGNAPKRLPPPADEPDNPVYLDLKTQLASADLEIAGLRELIRKTQAELADYEGRIRKAPLVEQEYSALTRDHQNARRRYDEISAKLMEARTAQGLEQSEQGERFTLAEAPSVPESPYKPNRLAIVLLGLTLGLGAGVGAAAARESMDRSVKMVDELGDLTQVPVLSVLPFIQTREEKRRRQLRGAGWAFAVLGLFAVSLTVVHRSVVPLDTLFEEVVLPKIQTEMAKYFPISPPEELK